MVINSHMTPIIHVSQYLDKLRLTLSHLMVGRRLMSTPDIPAPELEECNPSRDSHKESEVSQHYHGPDLGILAESTCWNSG